MAPPVPSRRQQVVHRELAGGQVVLLHLQSGAYHELNAVGGLIWELVDGDRTVREIVEEFRRRVDDPPEDVDAVVDEFLTALRQRDLIT